MSPIRGRQKFLLRIVLLSACFYLFCLYYFEIHDFLSKPVSQTQKSNPNKNFIDSTVNFWSEAKNLSTVREFPSVSRIREPGKLTLEERNHILYQINSSNVKQTIYNAQTFGLMTKNTFVIVIQVHFRFEYLELLVQSLADAQGINDSLIIFSHDVYSPEMNAAIQHINFARVLQIFLPITRQTAPKLYPGKVWTWGSNHGKIGSRMLAKQHWWWKANFLFNKVNVLKKHEGVIHFLEEDYYVIPDYITVMKKLEVQMRDNDCFGCNVLNAGHEINGGLISNAWRDGKHNVAIVSDLYELTVNRGLAFNRTLWNKIKVCEKIFCDTFKETNWDFSLIEVSISCMKTSRIMVLLPEAPRLFHVGDCGMHYQKNVCNPLPYVAIIKEYVKQFDSALFPQNMSVSLEFMKKRGPRLRSRRRWTKNDAKLCFVLGV